ncbi:polysaccharide deacetylase family protein [Bacillus sp. EB106-08-02-XG196]|jgi:peptidoglycan-N-acetylglucosamine deacetylase|uniref:polysaccharide deacetylase family protein n=1 Tax=Bacillus sp. EB106-08-02-XG196 TaxID=2737049 RepID=UPI0015C46B94|nr:polysaccharide deacetylase family protein [Bacillus sp. EB106-08-02-XG196]NWQ43660.1 polysaccharide deacetylase family protein [Bacillus sp. EB106-08-02-XG196]
MINEVSTAQRAVAITFDDGPNPVYTPQVLEIFSEAKGKATFFMIGEQMGKYPEVVKQVADQGHEIGNHTFTHPKLSQLSIQDCLKEIEETEKLIEKMAGRKPVVFRPPYLDYNQDTVSLLQNKRYPMIGALNLEAQDWEQPGVEHIVRKSREAVKNGSILIFHDGYGDRSQTIEAVRMLVSELTSQGYQLVTVSELLALA